MYLRKVQRKNKDGTAVVYYQLAHNERHPKTRTPVARILYSFGRADDIDKEELSRLCKSIARVCNVEVIDLVEESDNSDSSKKQLPLFDNTNLIKTVEWGTAAVIEAFWERLGIRAALQQFINDNHSLEKALLAMTAHRVCEPESPVGTWNRWLDRVYLPSCQRLTHKQIGEAMDMLQSHGPAIEKSIFSQAAKLLNLDTDLIFYSTAPVSLVIEEGDSWNASFVIALAVTKQGLPLRSWIFPDTMSQEEAAQQVKADLIDWNMCRSLFVADENHDFIKKKYLLINPITSPSKGEKDDLLKKRRYKVVKADLHVKKLTTGEGENQKHYLLLYNKKEAEHKRTARAQALKLLEEEIARHNDKKVSPLLTLHNLSSHKYKHFIKKTKDNTLSIDHSAVRQEEQNDGKWIFETDDDTVDAEDALSGQKGLMIIKKFFSTQERALLKQSPDFFWSFSRFEAYVKISNLALLIKDAAEFTSQQQWLDIQQILSTLQRSEFHSSNQVFYRRNEVSQAVKNIFKSLDVKVPESGSKIQTKE